MVCHIASNRPLRDLRLQLDLSEEEHCHSVRPNCARKLAPPPAGLKGIAGAALGYCQALFGLKGGPTEHTETMRSLLTQIGAPMPDSHELFYGYKPTESLVGEYIEHAASPLKLAGRVPILITGLDVSNQELVSIFDSNPVMASGETMLVRTVLSSRESIGHAVSLVHRLTDRAGRARQMPSYWPLFQAAKEFTSTDWKVLRETAGEAWFTMNVAINPFIDDDSFGDVRHQVTVAQFPIGDEGHIDSWRIKIDAGIPVTGTDILTTRTYDPIMFASRLKELPVAPTLIVLGPSREGWDEGKNMRRLAQFVPVLHEVVGKIWRNVPSGDREMIMSLPS